MTAKRNNTGSCRGFTLVELVIVVAIIAVVAAIALPRFSQAASRQKLEAAADRVAADLALARARARAASQTVDVSFAPLAEAYTVSGSGGQVFTVDLAGSPYGVDLSTADFNGSSSLSFNGFGVPSHSGLVTLSSQGTAVTVKLDTAGEVRR